MKTMKLLLTLGLAALWAAPTQAAFTSLRTDVWGDKPEVVLLKQNSREVQLEIKIPGLELTEGILDGQRWDRVEILGGGYELDIGAPEVPHFTRLLIIPSTVAVHAQFEALETTTIPNILLMPAQGDDPEEMEINGEHGGLPYHPVGQASPPVKYDLARYQRNELYPSQRVMVGEPAVMRGLRVAALRLNPVQYNPVSHELVVTTKFRVTVEFEGQDLRNVPVRQAALSRSWANMVKSQSFNFDESRLEVDQTAEGSYLIVCQNNATLINNLQPLIEWKERKGHSVTLQTFSAGATNTAIKQLIQTAYDTWDVPPEYVLLVGDITGSYALPAWTASTDHSYSQLEGNDILPDVALGRLPTENASQTQAMVNKILWYEKDPYIANSDWFHSGLLIAYWAGADLASIQTARTIKTYMLQNGYTRVDTLWYGYGSVPSFASNSINNGVSFFNYNGWIGMGGFGNDDIDMLTNGRKLPFVTLYGEGTGGFSNESNTEHFVKVGTPAIPKGAVGAIGIASLATEVPYNCALAAGFYAGLFNEGITTAGQLLTRSKMEMYNAYIVNYPTGVTNFFNWTMLAGDPGLDLYAGPIHFLTCAQPDSVPWGENSLTLTVTESGVGPVEGATACLYKANDLQSVGLTDAIGQVSLPLDLSQPGNVKVTITKHNYYPMVDSLDVVQTDVAVGYYDHTVDDDAISPSYGDGDGVINPGETVVLTWAFKNYGDSVTATNVGTTVSENDPLVNLQNPTSSFPDLAPGDSGVGSTHPVMWISPTCPDGHVIPLTFNTVCNQGNWPGQLNLEVVSWNLAILSAKAAGSDSLLSPGETANFLLTVWNQGHKNAPGLTATLQSLDPFVTVIDGQASFGPVNIDHQAICSADPFTLTASSAAPVHHQAYLAINFYGATPGGSSQHDTITITLGNCQSYDPQGPDAYGYYCYDNTDLNYPQHPTYDWVEIDPAYGGSGYQLPINDPGENNDVSVNRRLPFQFRYYGEEVDTITVCSNGWISTQPNASLAMAYNYPIPSFLSPTGMIAPFWDDLITWSGGHVFTLYDSTNHRCIIEWSRVKALGSPQPLETFEIILLDPVYYPTHTGDGKIIFQYDSITEVVGDYDQTPYSTVGIESPDHLIGIQVVNWNVYRDPAAAHLQAGRAYLFTPDFTWQLPTVDLTLAPINPPIIIPASGGSFDYDVSLANNGASTAFFDVWIMQYTPHAQWQGPMQGPVNLTLPAGVAVTRLRSQSMPDTAAPGRYTYRGYVGMYNTAKWDSSSFTYTKLDTGDGPRVSAWENTGESFAPYLSVSSLVAEVEKPTIYALDQIRPNPFNPTTAISYQLSAFSQVNIRVYDLSGRLVRTLVDGWQQAGSHEVTFDGSGLSSGLYFVRMKATEGPIGAGEFTTIRKMMLVK